jgi:[ribosomal protein S18]-alanine N-acetyltransferase
MLRRFSIRRIRASDLDRILEIEAASFGKDAYDRKLFAEYLHKCGEMFLGAWKGRKLCGYVLTRIGGGGTRAELISIAVDPAFRRKGLAALMLESTLRRLRRRGVVRFSLMVKVTNDAARGFYEKYGFVRTRRVPIYYEDGEDGILMALALSEPRRA